MKLKAIIRLNELRNFENLSIDEQYLLKDFIEEYNKIDLDDFLNLITEENELLVSLIIKAGIDVCCCNNLPIVHAAMFGNTTIMKMLIDAGADPTAMNNRALREVLAKADTEATLLLLQNGAKLSEEWPLEYLTSSGPFEILVRIFKNFIFAKAKSFKIWSIKKLTSLKNLFNK